MNSQRRRYTAPPDNKRCTWNAHFHGEGARCMRASVEGDLCRQHHKMWTAMDFKCCGGNDEMPPSHTADCDAEGAA